MRKLIVLLVLVSMLLGACTSPATPPPAATEAPKPAATEAPKPAATEAPKPVTTEAPKPVTTEAPKPVTTEAPKPAATTAPTSAATPRSADANKLVLATTTSTQDSGLLDVLLPEFEKATGTSVDVIAVGSGQALKLGEDGNADVLLVHSPAAEKTFMDNKHGVRREDVMYNDFVIVGPASDPAGIKDAKTAVEAFKKIAASGAPFISRGDKSGTNAKELAIWTKAGIEPKGDWYISAGQGMGEVLSMANEKQAYTLSDRATYLTRTKNGLKLDILVQGDKDLLNPYGVIAVDPAKSPAINAALAQKFIDWIISVPVQEEIGQFGVKDFGQQLFIPISKPYLAAHPEAKGLPTAVPTAAAPAAVAPAGFKACQVTDTGGIDDKSFNATAWKGVEDAMKKFGIEGKYLESQQQTDYEKNIQAFLDDKCNVIITVGFLLGDATKTMAEKNKDTKFSIVDFAYDPVIPNVVGQVFSTDQAAFLAGYAAAGMSKTGKVGTFGGIQIPPVTVFMDGFALGVAYYNQKHGTKVEVLGWDPAAQTGLFTGDFESTDKGQTMGQSLLDEGADIIMPVAGPVGLGTAAAVQQRGNAYIIGVDADWYQTNPQYKDIILTSVLKNMDITTLQAIQSVIDGSFKGGVIVGNLANGGVGLAPFHDLDSKVPAELKAELAQVAKDIIAGTVATAPKK